MRISRRRFVTMGGVATAFCASQLPRCLCAATGAPRENPCLLHSRAGFAPYLDPFLKQIRPGNDEFVAEKYAFELADLLKGWAAGLADSSQSRLIPREWLPEALEAAMLDRPTVETLRANGPVATERVHFPAPAEVGREAFLKSAQRHFSVFTHIEFCDLRMDAIEILSTNPLRVRTEVHYDMAGALEATRREQRTGGWEIHWQRREPDRWQITRWGANAEMRARLNGPGFVDVTAAALGENESYRNQLHYGLDHWRTVLDAACGIDVYGNNGVCVCDFDGDGFDDIYVCQPAGLPNRLYKNRGDGRFEDVTEKAGVGVLDGTACALFADLTNSGQQDLIVVRDAGPLLFVNRGDGTFELKPGAFEFARPLQGSFTGASLADYDRDGLLDVYFCTYSFSQGVSGTEYPTPYYDAQNGPPNFLMRNRGNHTFEDVTVPSGMDAANKRFSFAAVWNDYDRDGWADLYVVNDFGRKVLYRNNRNGTFTDVSAQAGVEDPGEGMSSTWFDYDNDGWEDIYAVNMFESAGARVSSQPQFMPAAPEAVRRIVRQDALGNTLLHHEGASGTFRDSTEQAGTRYGGWNWGSDAWDFDHDGYADLYVANGFVSGENREDVSSFFWRQIAARSMDAGGRAQTYADAWSAINEFIRSDYTWSGYQRNNFYVNNRNASFCEAASLLGIGCIQDCRSFALGDLNGDGRLELVVKNRTAPQVRIFENHLDALGPAVLFSLRGVKSNRDAIGAVVDVECGNTRQTRTVRAGSGFLSQNSKTVHFGLGETNGPVRATIRWPSGAQQLLERIPPNHRIEVIEGTEGFRAVPLKDSQPRPMTPENPPAAEGAVSSATWLLDPIQFPVTALKDRTGAGQALSQWKGRACLLAFVSPACSQSSDFLAQIQRGQAELKTAGVEVIAIVMDSEPVSMPFAGEDGFHMLFADASASRVFDVFRRYLFDRRRAMPLPSALLLDEGGNAVRLYHGAVGAAEIVADAKRMPRSASDRIQLGLPFAGQHYGGEFRRDSFTLGVAYMQIEAYDQAQLALERVIERNPSNALANYDLGLIALYKNQPAEARRRLEKAVELDPGNADAWNNLGVAMGQSGDQDQARRSFQQALARQPAHPNALENMMRILRNENQPEEARVLLLKAIEADSRQPSPHRELGQVLLEAGEIDAARKELETALQLDPTNPEALNALGVVYMQTRDDDRALQKLTECARLAPDFAGPILNMAVIYMSAGKAEQAHQVLSEFLSRHPENRDVRQALREVDSRR